MSVMGQPRDKTITFRGQELKASDLYSIIEHISRDKKEIFGLLEYEGYNPLKSPFEG